MLAIAAPQAVLRSQLIALLWSRRELEQARGSLREALRELRDALGGLAAALLAVDRHQVVLKTDGLLLDISDPIRITADPAAQEQPRLLHDLNGIDPAFDAWLGTERQKLTQRDRAWAEAALRATSHPEHAVAAALALLSIDRTHEGAWQALIQARLDQGDRTAAIASFDECRLALAQAAQLTPSAAITKLIADTRNEPTKGFAEAAVPLVPGGAPFVRPQPSGRVRVGVAPLRALGGVAADQLAAGLTEELSAALARFRWIACVPIAALATGLPETAGDRLWRSLDLDFLLDGIVQQSGGRFRVINRLLNLHSAGEVVWSGRFDREIAGILELQDDLAGVTVAQLEPNLLRWGGQRVLDQRRASTLTVDVSRLTLPTLFHLDRFAFQDAGRKLEHASSLDPENPFIHAWLGEWHLLALGQGWASNVPESVSRARDLAERVMYLAPDDARALSLAGHFRGFIEARPSEALVLHERAILENPNLSLAWCRSAFAHSYAGQHQEALQGAARARYLSRSDPLDFLYEGMTAIPYLLLGDYEEAARRGARAIALNPGFSSSYKTQLAALGHLGLRDKAAEIRARLLALEPEFSVSRALERSPIQNANDRNLYAEGLKLGGLP